MVREDLAVRLLLILGLVVVPLPLIAQSHAESLMQAEVARLNIASMMFLPVSCGLPAETFRGEVDEQLAAVRSVGELGLVALAIADLAEAFEAVPPSGRNAICATLEDALRR